MNRLCATVCVITAGLCLLCGCRDTRTPEETAADIHAKALTIDTHVDTPSQLYYHPGLNLCQRNEPGQYFIKVDFPRMLEGGLDAAVFALFVGQGERTADGNRAARQLIMDMYDLTLEAIDNCSRMAGLARTPDDAYALEKEGKRAVYLGIENGYAIGSDLSLIQTFHDMGIRYITLCHSSNNDICDSSTDAAGPEHGGLSGFGAEVVAEMNRVGMIVDVSHISDEAFYDVLELSSAPVIASHSNTDAYFEHARNMDDGMLKKLAENGGVIQLSLLYVVPFVTDVQPTVSQLVDHIDHIAAVAGIDHAGIGSDFDGGGCLEDCYDVSQMGNITLELVNRGYTEEEILKIWGGNFMRVFRDVMAAAEPPS